MLSRTFTTCLACILLWYTNACAQLIDPVEFDGSQAMEMEVKWSWKTGATSACSYLPDFCGAHGSGVVTFFLDGEMRTWPTTPLLDTVGNQVQWINGKRSGTVYPIDYDGTVPDEYINLFGYVFSCNPDRVVLEAVDTIPASATVPGWQSDVNADGHLDVVFPSGYEMRHSEIFFNTVMGGPEMGRGSARIVSFPNPFQATQVGREVLAMRLMRCGDGQLRIVYCGTPRKGQSGVWLLDVHLEKRDTGWHVEYTVADSVVQSYVHNNEEPSEPRVVWPVTCVDDPNTHRQWAIVNWQQGYHRAGETTVLYEVTGGKLEERMVHRGVLISGSLSCGVHEGTFDGGESIVWYGKAGYQHFARISALYKPFAKVISTDVGSDRVFIDDQNQDGSRDLFTTLTKYDAQGNPYGIIKLVNFDLRPSTVYGPTSDTLWVRLQGRFLVVQVRKPTTLAADAVSADGRLTRLLEQSLQPGEHKIDLAEPLRALPTGATFLRISDGQRHATIPYLK